LVEVGAVGEFGAAVEEADVVEAEEAAFEDVAAVLVLAVDPPGEVDEEFLEDAFEENAVAAFVAFTLHVALNAEDAQRGPRVHGRVDIAEGHS